MSIFGTKQNPAIVRVQTQERAYEISELCEKNGWQVIVGIEVDKPENIDDVLQLALHQPEMHLVHAVVISNIKGAAQINHPRLL
jgi:hypothetical protein